ncbi:MAG: hypothetical protein KGD73_10145 [Candidatus Lokiarchaeota archaeon]|nr:hypothetical protein [Candidatus Lokiarchaeota archaeon]
MSELNPIIEPFKEEFQQIFLGNKSVIDQVLHNAKEVVGKCLNLDDFKRKFAINLLKEITLMLKAEEINHKDFFLDNMRENVLWQPIVKVILAKRIEELKKCKVLKKGKKYNISGLKETYLGKMIVDKLGFTRRSIISDLEYDKLISIIKKLKYEIPVIVQPTETEKFFEN